MRRFLSILLFLLCLASTSAYAHPGQTDEYGGHYDYSFGDYHYHHGFPAHYHKDGYCPYNFVDNTGENSGTPGSGTSVHYYTTAPRSLQTNPPYKTKVDTDLITGVAWVAMMIGVFAILFLACLFFTSRSSKKKPQTTEDNSYRRHRSPSYISENAIEAQRLNRLSGIDVTKTPPPPPPPAPAPVKELPKPVPIPKPKVVPIIPTVPVEKHEHNPSLPPPPPPIPSVPSSPPVVLEPEPRESDLPNCPVLYRVRYPATWAYIQHNAKNPYSYVYYYHYVWGDLQAHHGDGIIYGSLSEVEQNLVNYPNIGHLVYLSSASSDKYHSTPNCYSLLKSTPLEVDCSVCMTKQRCTKCVPPNPVQ